MCKEQNEWERTKGRKTHFFPQVVQYSQNIHSEHRELTRV